ncbi:D-aminoacyl-tRNA deacylase isoform X2 [Cryptomeria japonica]|uniref:D-aminoacyl-tRNA deacylase isoform X2 n=1 Tax=Cryptomeria japonica TaxID=3369 RepID=UPI0027DA9EC5|nr:D-aminoacyl-tRNA deacylase isoform X2 [Cryptomeria japonica]
MRKGAALKDIHPLLQFLKVPFLNVTHSVYTKHFISSSLKVDTQAYVRDFSRTRSQLRWIDRKMVTLVVATTCDPASIGPASALLQMSSEWRPGPLLQDIPSFINGRVRLLKHDQSIVKEDDLDMRWEEFTGETVDEIIFLSKHTAVSNRPALTVHPIGVPHLQSYEECVAGGKPGWAGLPCPRIGAWYRLLQAVAEKQALTPEFEITLEATHHGPVVSKPTMFVEIGSTEEYWKRQDAAHTVALVVWQGLGLDGGSGVGNWTEAQKGKKVLVGIGGGHYVPRHMDIVRKEDVWVGHLLSGYSLPMEEPSLKKKEYDVNEIGGSWKQAISVAVATTQEAFSGGKVLVHIDNKNKKCFAGTGNAVGTSGHSPASWGNLRCPSNIPGMARRHPQWQDKFLLIKKKKNLL